jgi:phosphoribosyl 1,2-cyclic phosphodiesterase
MMQLSVIASSSNGNCYIIHNDISALIIEAGVSFKKVLEALNFNSSIIEGCIISHSHGDHAGKITEFAKRTQVYCSEETAILTKKEFIYSKIQSLFKINIGPFIVMPFALEHDVPCLGFIIYHPECGKILFITDTWYSKYSFDGINIAIVEANYMDELVEERLKQGTIEKWRANRLATSHMSLKVCKELLKANNLSKCRNIVLIHLSEQNSNAELFQSEIYNEFGITTNVAKPNTVIDITDYQTFNF